MENLYYEAPTDEVFEEVKKCATKIWLSYDDQFGYATGKIERIKDIGNVKDNVMYMVAMFDSENQAKLSVMLTLETKKAVSDRMVAGGQPPEYNPFLVLKE